MDRFKARQGSADAHKDANLRLTKKCGAGFHKATQYQPDLMRHKAANLHLTSI